MRTHHPPGSATPVPAGITVLLAGDSGNFARCLAQRLERDGCSVETVWSRDDLLACAGRPFDAIFLDLGSPDVNALAVLRELKSTPAGAQCPVVLFTAGDAPAHVIQRGLDLGAAACIVKDRVPDLLSMASLFESVGITYGNRPPRPPLADTCPHSALATFHECGAFMPINTLMHTSSRLERVSCSHLRTGTAEAWRLYPRCAIGNATARAKYARDQGS